MLAQIQDRFSESIQTQIAAAELLPKKLSEAAQRIVACLLRGNKIIVCGDGRSYSNAQLLVANLLQRYEIARPMLAAHLLVFNGVIAGHANQDNDLAQIYRKQLQSIACSGDLLVAFIPCGDEEAVVNAIHCAGNESVAVIAFTGSRNSHTSGLLSENDLEIAFPSNHEARIIEGHHFCLNLLCELVDRLLFSPTSH